MKAMEIGIQYFPDERENKIARFLITFFDLWEALSDYKNTVFIINTLAVFLRPNLGGKCRLPYIYRLLFYIYNLMIFDIHLLAYITFK